mmetsp:Transcript_98203/g.306283  ORF Transcript_98203/g.306283 Transcript_98203/m.306283 type:complete len:218 (-) Transcript_98203:298-951(-)
MPARASPSESWAARASPSPRSQAAWSRQEARARLLEAQRWLRSSATSVAVAAWRREHLPSSRLASASASAAAAAATGARNCDRVWRSANLRCSERRAARVAARAWPARTLPSLLRASASLLRSASCAWAWPAESVSCASSCAFASACCASARTRSASSLASSTLPCQSSISFDLKSSANSAALFSLAARHSRAQLRGMKMWSRRRRSCASAIALTHF